MKVLSNPESGRALREAIEAAGRAPVLGWHCDRKVPVNWKSTDVRATFRRVQRMKVKNGD